MKSHVEIGHLTKYDAFRVNRDQVMNLETWFEIHTNASNFLFSLNNTESRMANNCKGDVRRTMYNVLVQLVLFEPPATQYCPTLPKALGSLCTGSQ